MTPPTTIDVPVMQHVLSALAWTLLHFIWQGCALAAAFGLVMFALRRSSASQRYVAGCISLGIMALTPIITFIWLWRRPAEPWPLIEVRDLTAMAAQAAESVPLDRLHVAIVTTWLLGAFACLIWVAGGWLHVSRFRRIAALTMPVALQMQVDDLAERLNVRCIVRIVDHLAVVAPLTMGAIRPVILLPAAMLTGLTPVQLQAVLAHEMAHIRRMDFAVNLLQAALEALLFYHPAVWWISRQVRQEREYCCDDLAAEVCGNPVTYARALAELEALRGSAAAPLGLALSSQGGSLMKRIARLTDSHLPRSTARRWELRSLAGGAALALLAAGSSAFALAKQAAPATTPPTQGSAHTEVIDLVQAMRSFKATEAQDAQNVVWVLGQPLETVGEGEWQEVQQADGVWQGATIEVQGQPMEGVVIEGDEASGQWLALSGQVRFEVMLNLAHQIDPEHMPSDGLVQAAKLAYPFNLLGLMPWVAPEATDVLVRPTFEAKEGPAISGLLLTRARAVTRVNAVPVLSDLPLIGRTFRAEPEVAAAQRARVVDLLLAPSKAELLEGAMFEMVAEPCVAERAITVEGHKINAEKPAKESLEQAQPSQPKP